MIVKLHAVSRDGLFEAEAEYDEKTLLLRQEAELIQRRC